MITELQKKSAQAIVNVFETSLPQGDYSKVTLLRNDSGHLTFGRSQTTLASGNLFLLIKAYCDAPDAEFGEELSAYLGRLEDIDLSLDRDMTLRPVLREAGGDAVILQNGKVARLAVDPENLVFRP
ncbi:MAG: hypothetical protein E2O94_04165 [Alphaproteobacteria bacterium]|nr:MAG: hypothetical protein E2O94_04165 [Alphaproteobacteria bacterium]